MPRELFGRNFHHESALRVFRELPCVDGLHAAIGQQHAASAIGDRRVGQHGVGRDFIRFVTRAEIGEPLSAFHVVGDFVRVQLIHHFLERHWQSFAVIARENPRGQPNLFEIIDAADALHLGFCFAESGQQHRREDRHDRDDYERRDQTTHTASRRTHHQRDEQSDQHTDSDHARPDLAQNFAVE